MCVCVCVRACVRVRASMCMSEIIITIIPSCSRVHLMWHKGEVGANREPDTISSTEIDITA